MTLFDPDHPRYADLPEVDRGTFAYIDQLHYENLMECLRGVDDDAV